MSYEVHSATLQRQPAAVVRGHVKLGDIAEFLGAAFQEVAKVLGQQGLSPAGPPFGRYTPSDGGFEVETGFPVGERVMATGRVTPDELPGGLVAFTVHTGAYDGVGAAHAAATDWIADNGYVVSGQAWERYLDDPEVPLPRTEVFVPCKPMVPTTS